MPKNQNLKFHLSFNNFGRDPPPGVYMNFGEQIWCVLSEEMSFQIFSPIWFHVNENKKKNCKKSNIQNFEKQTNEKKKLVWRHGGWVPVTKICCQST